MNAIAQLIKLQDYVSRYEWNAYRYPTQYIRLKQENWQKLHHLWRNPSDDEIKELELAETPSTFAKWKAFMTRSTVRQDEEHEVKVENVLPKTEEQLKHYFLDNLYPFQLKWASSTVTDVSFMDRKFEKDANLKHFLQRFPDTYLVMYYPIFSIKNTPIDGELIFISPIGMEIIYLLEEPSHEKILAGDARTWGKEANGIQTKMLSPLLALKRTEQIVKRILASENVEFPIKKVVLARSNHIVFHTEPYNTKIIGELEYDKWFNEKRKLVSPLKNRQLKVIDTLLKHCQTTSVKRPEWEEDGTPFNMG